MYQELQNNIDLFIKNKEIMKRVFKNTNEYMQLANALVYTTKNKVANEDDILKAKSFHKSKTTAFSNFRGCSESMLITAMSLSDDPEGYLDKVFSVYKKMLNAKFKKSEYVATAAMIIVQQAKDDEDEIIKETNDIYNLLKAHMKSQINKSDIPLACILAISKLDKDELGKEIDLLFNGLKLKFKNSDARANLAALLAIPRRCPNEKMNYIIKIFDMLKEKKHKYPKDYEISVLGMFAFIDDSEEDVVNDIIETDDLLHKQKGFGNWTLGYEERMKTAAAIVCLTRINLNKKEPSSEEDIVNLVNTNTSILLSFSHVSSVAAMCSVMVLNSACRASN